MQGCPVVLLLFKFAVDTLAICMTHACARGWLRGFQMCRSHSCIPLLQNVNDTTGLGGGCSKLVYVAGSICG